MNHRRSITTLIPLLSLALLVVPQISYAQESLLSGAIQDVLFFFVTQVFGMFVWFGAALLNFGINHFVIGFGDVYNNSGIGVAVNNTWVIIRDFINLGFIFGLVYIGLRMILDSNNANTRRWLANLIIAALLINFSLFATKFVVDVSNKLATEIACAGLTYPQAKNTPASEKTGCNLNNGDSYRLDVGQALMVRMGISTAFSNDKDARPADSGWGYIFGTAILFLVAAFVFGAGGILLFIRFAVLNLYLVFSAAMFLGWVIPGIQDTMRTYWKGFLSKAFFAPLYLLMLYFSFKILDGLQLSIAKVGDDKATGTDFANPNWAKAFAKSNGANDPASATLGTLPFFVLICIFMIGSLVIAQKMGAEGARGALNIANRVKDKTIKSTVGATKRVAGGATFGLAARGGQAVVGGLANKASNSRRFQKLAAGNGIGNKFARGALTATRGVADSSFDLRRVGGLGKELGIGEGIKGGYVTRQKDKNKRDEEFFKSLSPLSDGELDSRENQARIEESAEEKTLEAQGIIESETKATEDLTVEIEDLGKEIEDLTEALKQQVKDGTITSAEQYEAERNIVRRTKQKEGVAKVRDEKLRQEILEDKLNQAGLDSALATDPKVKAQLREQQQMYASQLNARRAQGKTLTDNARGVYDANDSEEQRVIRQSATRNAVRNEVKFENQVKYLEGKKSKFDGSRGSFFSPMEETSYDELKKKYGGDAQELAKKSKENGESKKLAEQLAKFQKESGGDGEAPAAAAATPPPTTP